MKIRHVIYLFFIMLFVHCGYSLAPQNNLVEIFSQIDVSGVRFSKIARDIFMAEWRDSGFYPDQGVQFSETYLLSINDILKRMKWSPEFGYMESALTYNGRLKDAHITVNNSGQIVLYMHLEFPPEEGGKEFCWSFNTDLDSINPEWSEISDTQDPYLETLNLGDGRYKLSEGLILQKLQHDQMVKSGHARFPVFTLNDRIMDATEIFLNSTATARQNEWVLDFIKLVFPLVVDAHRGLSFGSQLTTLLEERALDIIREHFNAPISHELIIAGNTSEVVNKTVDILVKSGAFHENQVVGISPNAHHSFSLPFLEKDPYAFYMPINKETQCIDVTALGTLLKNYYENGGKIDWLFVPGADNVPGTVNDIPAILKLAKKYGIKVGVDGAQLSPHYEVDLQRGVLALNDESLTPDFYVFSGHKFSSGTLGASFLNSDLTNLNDIHSSPPETGGSVALLAPIQLEIGQDTLILKKGKELTQVVRWANDRQKFAVGSPNVIGTAQLATSLLLHKYTYYPSKRHKNILTLQLIRGLKKLENSIPGLKLNIFGPMSLNWESLKNRLGVVTFEAFKDGDEVTDEMIGGFLNMHGFNVRIGCFCAHNAVLCFKQVPDSMVQHMLRLVDQGHKRVSGLVRASLSATNSDHEIDLFLKVLNKLFTTIEVIDSDSYKAGEYTYVYSPSRGFHVDVISSPREDLIHKAVNQLFKPRPGINLGEFQMARRSV